MNWQESGTQALGKLSILPILTNRRNALLRVSANNPTLRASYLDLLSHPCLPDPGTGKSLLTTTANPGHPERNAESILDDRAISPFASSLQSLRLLIPGRICFGFTPAGSATFLRSGSASLRKCGCSVRKSFWSSDPPIMESRFRRRESFMRRRCRTATGVTGHLSSSRTVESTATNSIDRAS